MRYYNIPIFVPHKGCPFDCVFCNQKHITGSSAEVNTGSIRKTVDEYLKTLPKTDSKIEIAFFGGSFTGISLDLQRAFLEAAYEYVKKGDVAGIRLSTRPDYINRVILDQLNEFGVTTIELGVQSMDADVLKKSNRGHSSDDVKKAVWLIRQYPFSLGLQMMTGLPGDTPEKSMKTANEIIDLSPDFVRIYPTLVIKDTYLEKMYLAGVYKPQSVDEAVLLCKDLFLEFKKADIAVIRISLQTTDEISPGGSLVAGPYDAQFGELVITEVFYDKLLYLLEGYNGKQAKIAVNPKDISKVIGKGRKNIKRIYERYKIELSVIPSDEVDQGEVIFSENIERED